MGRKAGGWLLVLALAVPSAAQPGRVDIGKILKRRRAELLGRCVVAERAGVDRKAIEEILAPLMTFERRPSAREMLGLIEEAERRLSQIFPPQRERAFVAQLWGAAQRTPIFLLPQCHIDLVWQWCWRETVEVAVKTFRAQLELARRVPGYVFCQDQAALYEAVERADPALFREIQRAVREGRWRIVGGNWAETVMEQCTGESVVRNFLLGKRYFREKFGLDVKVAWQMEGTGLPSNLPQVLKGCGFEGAIFGREEPWTDIWRPICIWRGSDGTEIPLVALSHYALPGFALPRRALEAVAANWPEVPPRLGFVIGGGDHGGGPNPRMLREVGRWVGRYGLNARLSGPEEFFRGLDKTGLPTVEGMLKKGGVGVVTQWRAKRLVRRCEHLLLTLEALRCALALSGVDKGAAGNVEGLTEMWKTLLVCEFHDALWGSTSYEPYTEVLGWLKDLERRAEGLIGRDLSRLAAEVRTRGEGVPVLVFNPLPHRRNGIVKLTKVPAPLPEGRLVAVDSEGLPTPVERGPEGLTFVARKVPPLGHKVFWLRREGPGEGARAEVKGGRIALEADGISASLDARTGRLLSVRAGGAEVRFPGGGFGLEVWRDVGSAWGSALTERIWKEDEGPIEVRILSRGPAVAAVSARMALPGGGWVERVVSARPGLPWVECSVRGEWRLPRAQLLAIFDMGGGNLRPFTGAPFGFVDWEVEWERRLKRGGIVERMKALRSLRRRDARELGYEVPQLRWADICDERKGLALLNRGKFGVRLKPGAIVLPIVRSPPFVKQGDWVIYRQPPNVPQFNDIGPFEAEFALAPHWGDWREGNIPRLGLDYNFPLPAAVAGSRGGRLPPTLSLLSVEGPVLLSCLKPAGDRSGDLVLRLFEPFGKGCKARLRLGGRAASVAEANLLEKPRGGLGVGGQFEVALRPFQILTLRLSPRGP